MPPWTGFFNNSGSPAIRVTIHGAFPQAAQDFDAIIDTGFTGFISMPLIQAFPLALILSGTTTVMLADGSVAPKLMGFGVATVDGESQHGLIILEPTSTEVLLGMEFLRRFCKKLVLQPVSSQVLLVDDQPAIQAPPSKKLPPDDPNKAAKAGADQVIDATEKREPPDDPNVAAHEAVKRLMEDD